MLEVFTYNAEKSARAPQLDVAGFAYAELAGDPPPDLTEARPDGTTVYVDPDGFAFSARPTGASHRGTATARGACTATGSGRWVPPA